MFCGLPTSEAQSLLHYNIPVTHHFTFLANPGPASHVGGPYQRPQLDWAPLFPHKLPFQPQKSFACISVFCTSSKLDPRVFLSIFLSYIQFISLLGLLKQDTPLGGSDQQKFIVSQFWKLEVLDPGLRHIEEGSHFVTFRFW